MSVAARGDAIREVLEEGEVDVARHERRGVRGADDRHDLLGPGACGDPIEDRPRHVRVARAVHHGAIAARTSSA